MELTVRRITGGNMTKPRISKSRLAQIGELQQGSHQAPNGDLKACLLEAVAYVAEEPWSDHPQCVSPVLAAFGRSLNDQLSHAERQRLLPFVPHLVETVAGRATDLKRAYKLADAAVHVFAPLALRARGYEAQARALEACAEIVDRRTALAADAAATWAAGVAARATAHAADYAAHAADHAADREASVAAYSAAAAAAAAARSADRKRVVDAALEAFAAAIAITE